jgi:Zn-dependent membrane protease YugP
MFYDPLWFLFAIPGLLIGLYARMKLSAAYGRYSRVGTASGLSGAEAAREILDRAGLRDIPVGMVPGKLTDHFDPQKRELFLSADNFNGRSVAAVGVAAHEAGHALQQQASYAPLKLRMAIVPLTGFASQAAYWLSIASVLMYMAHFISRTMFGHMIWGAVVMFAIVTFFQLITLPVEFDASRRAKEQLARLGIIQVNEAGAVHEVLGAAAMTYVAGMVTALLNLLYWVTVARNRV